MNREGLEKIEISTFSDVHGARSMLEETLS